MLYKIRKTNKNAFVIFKKFVFTFLLKKVKIYNDEFQSSSLK